MFLIYTIEDKILLKPSELNIKVNNKELYYEEVILERTRSKYIGKVLLNHGIVVTIKKLVIKNNMIVEIEGLINVEYEMDLIVFKPQLGDILFGKIIQSDLYTLTVDCGIIKVKVPKEQLMKPNSLDENENIWYWKYEDFKLYYDIGEEVRLKVIEVSFKTSQELAKMFSNLNAQNANVISQMIIEESQREKITSDMVMEVLCSFNQEGLGPVKWWQSE